MLAIQKRQKGQQDRISTCDRLMWAVSSHLCINSSHFDTAVCLIDDLRWDDDEDWSVNMQVCKCRQVSVHP